MTETYLTGSLVAQDVDTLKMPVYEYSCYVCGGTREIEASMNELHITPNCCEISMARVWSATSAIFKGNGFYKTDNR